MSAHPAEPESEQVVRERSATRATPLPEESGTGGPTGDGAKEILRESEERIAGADEADDPADDATQRRRSEETL